LLLQPRYEGHSALGCCTGCSNTQGSGRGPSKRLRLRDSSEAIESHLNIKIVAARRGVAGFGSGISHRAPSPVCPRAPRNTRSHCAMTGFRQSFRYRSVKWPDAGAPSRSHDREDRVLYRHRLCSVRLILAVRSRFPAADPRLDRPPDPGPLGLSIASNLALGFRRSSWLSSRFCRSCCRAFSTSSTAWRSGRHGSARRS
jgi:hypothetical protein